MADLLHDFHTHTFLSDGELSPVELIRRAHVRGYRVIGVADHAGPGNLLDVVRQLVEACAFCQRHWDIRALPGVELTHLPPIAIAEAAREARMLGAEIVVVHGETPVEPVPPGTNWAAIRSPDVDVLGHPGFLSSEEAVAARELGVFIELSARRGHSLANGHVARACLEAGSRLIVDSDAHHPDDLLTRALAAKVARGAGLTQDQVDTVLNENPVALLERLARRKEGNLR
ncbi:MAG: histidinol phosphate phosphatase domain-containing protein [Chloroflexota bacterium]|nr:MAG: histidinol phosphate phosphatase domain-containing protein [Chloroflexota bacterium]